MTNRADVADDINYTPILDHGFVGLVDHMGSDQAIVDAARLSYAKGTKQVNSSRGLVRYLLSHRHTSPFEMCEIKLHLKIPMFVMRQLVRHRTSSLNEMSARYSILPNEFYIPDAEALQPQSATNKQGRAGELTDRTKEVIQQIFTVHGEASYALYEELLNDPEDTTDHSEFYENLDFDENYPGLTRELSRMVLPVNVYTELYWKQDLHNMLHLVKLRADPHAQYEIRVLAEAMHAHLVKLYPETMEAWNDYVREASTFNRMDITLLRMLVKDSKEFKDIYKAMAKEFPTRKDFASSQGMTVRELDSFEAKVGLADEQL